MSKKKQQDLSSSVSLLYSLLGTSKVLSESESEFLYQSRKWGNVCVAAAKGQLSITINNINSKKLKKKN